MKNTPLVKDTKTALELAEEIRAALKQVDNIGWDKFSKMVLAERGHKSRKKYAKQTGICETVFYNKNPRCLSQFETLFADENQ